MSGAGNSKLEYEYVKAKLSMVVPDDAERIITLVEENYTGVELIESILEDILMNILAGVDYSQVKTIQDIEKRAGLYDVKIRGVWHG